MTQDEMIEAFLQEVQRKYPAAVSNSEMHRIFFPSENIESYRHNMRPIVAALFAEDLIEYHKTAPEHVQATPAGKRAKSYRSVIDEKEEAKSVQQTIDKLSKEKLELDVKNAKRIYETYWFTFAFSIAALLISLMLLLNKIIESANSK